MKMRDDREVDPKICISLCMGGVDEREGVGIRLVTGTLHIRRPRKGSQLC
jgi:hypothetical protein